MPVLFTLPITLSLCVLCVSHGAYSSIVETLNPHLRYVKGISGVVTYIYLMFVHTYRDDYATFFKKAHFH